MPEGLQPVLGDYRGALRPCDRAHRDGRRSSGRQRGHPLTSHLSTASAIWNASGWPEYYETHRRTAQELYPSEWFFLKDLLSDGMSVLDIGCAVGGLASVVAERVR